MLENIIRSFKSLADQYSVNDIHQRAEHAATLLKRNLEQQKDNKVA